jgi:hypothetical protein
MIIAKKAMLPTTKRLHEEIGRRIEKHFQDYEQLPVDGSTETTLVSMSPSVGASPREIVGRSGDRTLVQREVSLHLLSSQEAIAAAHTALHDFQNELIDVSHAIAGIVTSLELSLQHLHKVLIRFPPTE